MRHAFDYARIEQAAGPPASSSLPLHFNRSEAVLLALALPPVLLVIWLCAIQHNWQRGIAAVRHCVSLGPAGGRPLPLAGGTAGFVLVLGVTIIGGTATASGVLAQPMIWVLILLPEAAWAGPMTLVGILLSVREACLRLPMRQAAVRRGAFE